MAEVIIKDLVKEYGDSPKDKFLAVKGINLEIKDREFMVLVGPSGCGKSTTLRMVAGLEDISGGTISIGDTIVNEVQPKDRGIAMVFQNYALYPHMSVYDNMAFGLKLMKFPKDEIKSRVEDAAEVLGLTDMLNRKPKALSGGQRQRVAVGRAIVRKPKVFLFDEPLSNLDAKMRVQMRAEISKLHSRLQATMIYVTHDQTEAMTMGDRICVMKDGNIMQVDTPLQIYNEPENMFVASFIGSPPMNFFHGSIVREGESDFFVEEGEQPFKIPLNRALSTRVKDYIGKPIVLGVRPEQIVLSEDSDESKVNATVGVVEPMGAETFLYLDTNKHGFIVRLQTTDTFEYGASLSVALDLENVKFFDPESENVIKS